MVVGEIYRLERFYADAATGELLPKYAVLLACPHGDDIVARLLTSRQHGRSKVPACSHEHPYAGYYLGVPGGELSAETWVDLRFLDDFDSLDFAQQRARGRYVAVLTLPRATLRSVIECVAGADDTTRRQEQHLRNALAALSG